MSPSHVDRIRNAIPDAQGNVTLNARDVKLIVLERDTWRERVIEETLHKLMRERG